MCVRVCVQIHHSTEGVVSQEGAPRAGACAAIARYVHCKVRETHNHTRIVYMTLIPRSVRKRYVLNAGAGC